METNPDYLPTIAETLGGPMRLPSWIGLVAGALLLASSLAHAFAGWPALTSALDGSGVAADLQGALAVGWFWGSASMAAFGLIVTIYASRRLRGDHPPVLPIRLIAVTYLLFGAAAFLARDFNPHFLLFVVSGLLVGAATWRGGTAEG
jgi:hypothetical protein